MCVHVCTVGLLGRQFIFGGGQYQGREITGSRDLGGTRSQHNARTISSNIVITQMDHNKGNLGVTETEIGTVTVIVTKTETETV